MNLRRALKPIKYIFSSTIILALLLGLQGEPVKAQTTNAPTITLQHIASGLTNPTAITNAGDDSGRLFIVEQGGWIKILSGGSLISTPFLDISDRVKTNGGEEGLLGLAFPRGYTSKRYFYVYYTNLNGDNQVSRFSLSANPNVANPNSEKLILYLPHPGNSNHNGGQLAFGPDGYLYIGVGDGGGAGDPNRNAQNLTSLLGKILRIGVEYSATHAQAAPVPPGPNKVYLPMTLKAFSEKPYFIPSSNPFADNSSARPEIWAFGLRNPWRFSFDRANGSLYIADVGQDEYEEIDIQNAGSAGGRNYGWNTMEGPACYNPTTNCDTTGLTWPAVSYPHTPPGGAHEENGCAVVGGYVYRGQAYPALTGMYFFGDFCSGRIWTIDKQAGGWQPQLLLDTSYSISTFGESEQGEIYVADYWAGGLYKLTSP